MSRRLVSLTLDTLTDLPHPCRDCIFWELDPAAAQEACAAGDPALEKEAWISQTLLEWGSCGKLIYVDDAPAGYVIYAPPTYFPRSRAFPTSPPSPDAALLTAAHVVPGYAGGGLGRMLVQGAARDLARRGLKAIEAFGDACEPNQRYGGDACEPNQRYGGDACEPNQRYGGDACEPNQRYGGDAREPNQRYGGEAHGLGRRRGGEGRAGRPDPMIEPGGRCVVPAGFFVAVGFKTVRPHRRYPRLRLELRTALTWKSDVESALEKLFDTATEDVLLGAARPATPA